MLTDLLTGEVLPYLYNKKLFLQSLRVDSKITQQNYILNKPATDAAYSREIQMKYQFESVQLVV